MGHGIWLALTVIAAAGGPACAVDPGAAGGAFLASPAVVRDCSAPGSDGAACDDGRFCTVADRCHAGVCIGEERPCAEGVGFCALASCDEVHDTCAAAPRQDGCIDRCASTKDLRIYRRSWQRGFEVVSQVWDRRGASCARTDAFVDRIARRLESAQQVGDPDAVLGEHRRCRHAGVLDGAYAALEVIQELCNQVCFLDGTVVGEFAAVSYCELALAGDGPLDLEGWLRGPVDVCGLEYETGCDTAYIATSASYHGASGACEPLTEGDYETPWNHLRERACDYPE